MDNRQVSKNFLTANWLNLLMANFEVDKEILTKYVPFGTELDEWNNRYYVSLVGFMFQNTRLMSIPVPFLGSFEEVNLRFYVRYYDKGSWKRGVVFIKEIVPNPLITLVANSFYNEHYVTLPMKHQWADAENNSRKIRYEWKTERKWNFLEAKVDKKGYDMPEGSEEEFILEHYWGYTRLKGQKTSEYEVAHPRWQAHKVLDFNMDVNTKTLYGEEFEDYLLQQPKSILFASGSAIEVKHKKVITNTTRKLKAF